MKLRHGLQKINDTSLKINDLTKELEKVTELITKHTKECEEIFTVISENILEIHNQKKEFDTISMKIKKDKLRYQEIYNSALAELTLTLPGLEDAVSVRN